MGYKQREAALKAWETIRAKKRAGAAAGELETAVEEAKQVIRAEGWDYWADKLKSGGYSVKPLPRKTHGDEFFNLGINDYPSTMVAVLDTLGARKKTQLYYRWVIK
jgi:hypothetical protein